MNRNDPNRFDYLLRLMMKTLTEGLNSGAVSMTEESLQLLIKLAVTDPMFFERQLQKVLNLMLKGVNKDEYEHEDDYEYEVISVWQQRHAALIAIPEIAESCDKLMLENLEVVVPEVLKSLNDLHPHVQLAAINTIKQLPERFSPDFHRQYHEIFLITLVKVMNTNGSPKL
ncbi:hypothetical protein DITRI_Ditri06bG0128300 [Diplodiscus trichospermus]